MFNAIHKYGSWFLEITSAIKGYFASIMLIMCVYVMRMIYDKT